MGSSSSTAAVYSEPAEPNALAGKEKLQAQLSQTGKLLCFGDEGYEEARTTRTWNFDSMGVPSGIVVISCAQDVKAALAYAKENKIDLCIAAGRHSHYCMRTNSLVIDLSKYDKIEVDVAGKTVTAETGAQLGSLDTALEPHGLGLTAGHDPTTGIGGLVLHGGHGHLERTLGLTVDSMISAKMVLVDGKEVTVSEKENVDLFWAIRGGGGNFGVMLEYTFALQELPHKGQLVGGGSVHLPLGFWPFPSRLGLIQHYLNVIKDCPNELAGALILPGGFPVIFNPIWVGDHEDGKKLIAEKFQTSGFAVADTTLTPQSYYKVHQTAIQGPDGQSVAPAHYYMKGTLFGDISDGLAEVLSEWSAKVPTPQSSVVVVQLGGKGSQVPADATAVAHRHGIIWVLAIAKWMKADADTRSKCVDWVRGLTKALEAFPSTGKYAILPVPGDAETDDESSNVYAANLKRLQEIKKKYDPDNVLRMNDNIKPA